MWGTMLGGRVMDLFGKKRIAELEKENKKLQEEKDGALMLYSTTIKNHEQLEHEYRSLKAENNSLQLVIESKNDKVRELELENRDLKINFDSRERALKTLKDDRVERFKQIREQDKEIIKLEERNQYMYNRLVSIAEIFKDIDEEFIKDFRKARGRALNASSKRTRYKELNKMATNMEKLLKEIELDDKDVME